METAPSPRQLSVRSNSAMSDSCSRGSAHIRAARSTIRSASSCERGSPPKLRQGGRRRRAPDFVSPLGGVATAGAVGAVGAVGALGAVGACSIPTAKERLLIRALCQRLLHVLQRLQAILRAEVLGRG